MSGGVDSSVSAWILKKQGYYVEGLFMKNWEEDDNENYCHAAKDIEDAQSICDKLNIRLNKVNFATEYWDKVFKKFILALKQGTTPNPDILCNKEIKFKLCFNFAIKNLEADYIATGHYARIKNINKKKYLIKGIDSKKDQSYFLYTLNNKIMSFILFPIGHLQKIQVRKIASNLGFCNAKKKDSTGICFIGEKKFNKFLSQYFPKKIGNIIDINGNILGKHNGFMYYTIGQRKGLKIGGIKKNDKTLPWYVAKKDIEKNNIIVVQGKNNYLLFSSEMKVANLHWINNFFKKNLIINCQVKIRSQQKDFPCILNFLKKDNIAYVYFYNPVHFVTTGQHAVFYINKICLGGGVIIENSILNNF